MGLGPLGSSFLATLRMGFGMAIEVVGRSAGTCIMGGGSMPDGPPGGMMMAMLMAVLISFWMLSSREEEPAAALRMLPRGEPLMEREIGRGRGWPPGVGRRGWAILPPPPSLPTDG